MKNRFINVPFSPHQIPFFYGWVVLAAGALGITLSAPGQTIGISPFTDSLIKALAIERETLSLAYCIGTIGSALLLTWAGKFYDRFGVRITALITGVMIWLALAGLSRIEIITEKAQELFPDIAPAAVTFTLMAFGFFMVRFLGQGVMALVSRNMVMKWFERKRGFANSFIGLCVVLGFSLSPKLFNALIERYTWQGTWLILSVITGGGFLLLTTVFFRDNPEACGMIPDGNYSAKPHRETIASTPAQSSTLKQACSTYTFWIFNLAMMLFALYITALFFHITSEFNAAGMNREQAIAIFIPTALISAVFQIIGSIISDYIKLKYILMVFLCGIIISSTALACLAPGWPVYALIIGNGIFQGLFGVLLGVTWPRFFGLEHLGAISGFSLSFTVGGSAVGPYIFSLVYKHTGSYAACGIGCLAVSLLLLAGSFKADNPNTGETTAEPAGA